MISDKNLTSAQRFFTAATIAALPAALIFRFFGLADSAFGGSAAPFGPRDISIVAKLAATHARIVRLGLPVQRAVRNEPTGLFTLAAEAWAMVRKGVEANATVLSAR